MRHTFIALLFLLIIPVTSLAWQSTADLTIGTTHSITSEIYGKERQLMIALPEEAAETDKRYPVLYVLDGQKWFLEALSQYKVLQSYDYIPSIIIVGINTEDSPRYGFFAQADKLQDHLEKEIIPYVESNLLASDERIILGWQFASAFLIQTMAEKPQLFDAWLAASPYPIQGNRLNLLKQSLNDQSLNTGTLVFATNLNETSVEEDAEALEKVLAMHAPQDLHWKYVHLNQETITSAGHLMTPVGTLYAGLRTYYGNYPVLEFNNLNDYKAAGGFDYVKQYYQTRSKAYGFSKDIPDEGMFFLVRMSMDADAPAEFDFFMKQLKNTSFFANKNQGWNMRYADFYIEHKQYQNALDQYRIIADIFPESARPIHGMARAYAAMNNKKEAIKHFEKAIEMAEKANDSRSDGYKSDLEKFKEGG